MGAEGASARDALSGADVGIAAAASIVPASTPPERRRRESSSAWLLTASNSHLELDQYGQQPDSQKKTCHKRLVRHE
jgi:hypothetical protein